MYFVAEIDQKFCTSSLKFNQGDTGDDGRKLD